MKTNIKALLVAITLGLTTNVAVADVTTKWETVKGEDKFGNKFEYQQLQGKTTKIWKHTTENVVFFRQAGAIDCDKHGYATIKIDDQPVQEVSVRVYDDCKTMTLNPKDENYTVTVKNHRNIANKVIADLFTANKVVVQLNRYGTHAGKTEIFTIKK
jgi:hypothetical protein